MKNRLAISITAGALAALAVGVTVIPAAAAKAPRSAAVSSIHRPARANAAASPAASFRVRGVAPVSGSHSSAFRSSRAAAAAN